MRLDIVEILYIIKKRDRGFKAVQDKDEELVNSARTCRPREVETKVGNLRNSLCSCRALRCGRWRRRTGELGENLEGLEGVTDGTRSWERQEDLEGLEDNEYTKRHRGELVEELAEELKEEHKEGHKEELEDAAEDGAAPAPASAQG